MKDGEAKIADVGLSKDEEMVLGTVTGTPTTMSPEVLKGELYGIESDIYSVGIILWEMWYGRPAYTYPSQEQDTEYNLIAKNFNELARFIILGKRPDFECNYKPTKELKYLMEKCWEEDVRQRPKADDVLNILKTM